MSWSAFGSSAEQLACPATLTSMAATGTSRLMSVSGGSTRVARGSATVSSIQLRVFACALKQLCKLQEAGGVRPVPLPAPLRRLLAVPGVDPARGLGPAGE